MLTRIMRQAGVTLIEMMIALTVMGLLVLLAMPNMSVWLNNTQIRTAGETLLNGITLARAEAIRRNLVVRFQLTTSLDGSCTLSMTGTNWVVSLDDPSGACDSAPSGVGSPQVIQKKSGSEGAQRAAVAATGGTTVYYNGLGRSINPGGVASLTQIDITNPAGVCQNVDPTNGTMRCLRITISPGGQAKLCDPAVTDVTDPRIC